MSVTSVLELRETRSGSKDLEGSRSYTRKFRVECNSSSDGPCVVLRSSDLPSIGSGYRIGNDTDMLAVCEKLSAERTAENLLVWIVSAEYATQTPSDPSNNPGNPGGRNEDQIDPPEVSLSYAHYVKTALTGRRIEGNVRHDWGAITNSAMQPFVDPPIEIDDARPVIRISRSVKSVDETEASSLVNTINRGRFEVDWNKITIVHDRYTVKLQSISADRKYASGIWYWRVNYEFQIGDWNVHPLDIGTAASGLNDIGGDPWDYSTDIAKGKADLKVIKDVDNVPVNDPVLLNGSGGILHVNTFATNAVYLEYQVYEDANWGAYPIMRKLPHNLL